tara:strand:- start:2298 stop:3470 length:1173 start_codon:yes stop_codon:yes gene_type:complete
MKKRVLLCFVGHYLPGYRSGGPIRSISNLVENLGDEFKIHIICSDRDLSDKEPYANINTNTWKTVGKAKVFYVSKKNQSFKGIKKLLNETTYDLLYLNSFFSFKSTIIPLLLRKLGLVLKKPCIIAPRGEFSGGALKLKKIKKKIYIKLFKYLNLYNNLYWQASSSFEKNDIIKEITDVEKYIYIAPNLTTPKFFDNKKKFQLRKPGPLRILFLSRISPMKNLDFLLRILTKIKTTVELSIYGPKEDLNYWKHCLTLIDKLPPNIKLSINDEVIQDQVINIFKKHDLFVLPTRGENFGYVIIESLSAGLPALISDKTSWKPNAESGLQTLSLDEHKWVKVITNWCKFDDEMLMKTRYDSLNYAMNYNANNSSLKKNRVLFNSVLDNNNIV